MPRGIGPFTSWDEAAIFSYRLDGLNEVGANEWTWARACYEGELFNGFGYRARGVHTPCLWAGTSVYTVGKFVADGEFRADVVDKQLGIFR